MKLYKYLPPERIDVLTTLHVRFTQAEDFNDPFEVAPHLDAILPLPAVDALFDQLVSSFGAFDLQLVASVLASVGLTVDDIDELVASPDVVRRFGTLLMSGLPGDTLREEIKRFILQVLTTARPTFGTVFQHKFGTRFGILSLSEHTSKPLHILGNFPRVELVFTCVAKPNLGASPSPSTFQDETFIRLSNLKKLLDDGVITQEEFEREKAKILKAQPAKKPPN